MKANLVFSNHNSLSNKINISYDDDSNRFTDMSKKNRLILFETLKSFITIWVNCETFSSKFSLCSENLKKVVSVHTNGELNGQVVTQTMKCETSIQLFFQL